MTTAEACPRMPPSAVVGTATDVTVAELAIEAFYPADAATARALRSAALP